MRKNVFQFSLPENIAMGGFFSLGALFITGIYVHGNIFTSRPCCSCRFECLAAFFYVCSRVCVFCACVFLFTRIEPKSINPFTVADKTRFETVSENLWPNGSDTRNINLSMSDLWIPLNATEQLCDMYPNCFVCISVNARASKSY